MRTPIKVLLWRENSQEDCFGEKTFKKASLQRRPLRSILGREDLQEGFFWRDDYLGEKTSERTSIKGRPPRGLLWRADLQESFYGEKTFRKSYIVTFKRCFAERIPPRGIL